MYASTSSKLTTEGFLMAKKTASLASFSTLADSTLSFDSFSNSYSRDWNTLKASFLKN